MGRISEVPEQWESNEEWLQKYLANNPSLLPMQDLEGVNRPLRLISRELNGIDLLFVDDQGLLTVVETKLAENPEAKREVIAQILEYASKLSKLNIAGLCTKIARNDGKAIQGLDELKKLVQALQECTAGPNRKEESETAKVILANYVLKGKVGREKTKEVRVFLEKLESMLKEGSFRLVVVTYKASRELLELLNYVNSTMESGHHLVAVELQTEDISGKKYFVPHLVGAPNLLSPVYYWKEANRLEKEWDKDNFLKELPEDLRQDVSTLLNKVDDKDDGFFYEFGKGGKEGSVKLGVKVRKANRQNTLLCIWTSGSVTIYFSHAQRGLTQDQKNALVSKIGQYPCLRDAYNKIVNSMGRKSAEPRFNLNDCRPKGDRWKPLLMLLEDFYNIANT